MQNVRDAYLESQVFTSTPQRLRLMLIEGAQRFARQALQHWEQGDRPAGDLALERARSVVSELMSSIQTDGSPLSRKVAGIYLFLYRSLCEAPLNQDRKAVSEVLEVLEIERETWQQVCEQLPDHVGRSPSADGDQVTITTSSGRQDVSGLSPFASDSDGYSSGAGGLVLEA